MTSRTLILLDPANPNDFDVEEFDPLIEEIESDLDGAEVFSVFRTEVGYGGPFLEVLHVWIDVAETVDAAAISTAVLKRVVGFMRTRFTNDKRQTGELGPPRPRVVNLYGADGRILKSVQIDEAGVVEQEVDPGSTAPHRRPALPPLKS